MVKQSVGMNLSEEAIVVGHSEELWSARCARCRLDDVDPLGHLSAGSRNPDPDLRNRIVAPAFGTADDRKAQPDGQARPQASC